MLRAHRIVGVVVALLFSSGCVSVEAWHREEALVRWATVHENQRADSESPQAVQYAAAFGVGPNVNAVPHGTLPTTRPAAPPAYYQFSIAGDIFPHAEDRVIVFEVECFAPMRVVSTAHALSWKDTQWKEDWSVRDDVTPSTNP
jgi:hypothetical protein